MAVIAGTRTGTTITVEKPVLMKEARASGPFLFGANVIIACHSGAMRSIEPGISRFRVHASRAPE
jgi:hypothetical protein